MEEIKCKQVCQIVSSGYTEMTGRVYDKDGLSPSIRTFGGGNTEVKVLGEPLAYDEQNGYLREDGIVGTLTTDGSSPKHNNRVVEPLVYDGFNQQVKADSSTSGTITRNVGADLKRNGQGIIEPLSTRGSDIASTLRASMHKQGERNLVENLKNGRGYEGVVEPKQADFRVRKLTEKECFRLQGVKDEDFAKIRENQSKSSCYHLAGDSITSSVLMALFGEMLDIDWREKVNDLVEELQDM